MRVRDGTKSPSFLLSAVLSLEILRSNRKILISLCHYTEVCSKGSCAANSEITTLAWFVRISSRHASRKTKSSIFGWASHLPDCVGQYVCYAHCPEAALPSYSKKSHHDELYISPSQMCTFSLSVSHSTLATFVSCLSVTTTFFELYSSHFFLSFVLTLFILCFIAMHFESLTAACLLALASVSSASSSGRKYLWGRGGQGKMVRRQASSTSSAAGSTSTLVADSACSNGPFTRSCWTDGFSVATEYAVQDDRP